MDEHEEPKHTIAKHWKPVSLISIIGMIPVLIATNAWYEGWHERDGNSRYLQLTQAEAMYARKNEVAQLAQTDKLTAQLAQVDQNVDFLVKSVAVQTVDRIKGELTAHGYQDDGSLPWRRQKGEIERRLANAEAYRDCLFQAGSQNCDASRVW